MDQVKHSATLEEYAKLYTPQNACDESVVSIPKYDRDSLISEYIEVLELYNSFREYDEDFIRAGFISTEKSVKKFLRSNPMFQERLDNFVSYVQKAYSKYDNRWLQQVIYYPETVLFVVYLASLSGYRTCEGYAHYWFEENLKLQLLVPFMPSPMHMISAETIRIILKMLPEDSYEELFRRFFSDVKVLPEDLCTYDDDEATTNINGNPFRRTYGGDGQELRASFRRGEDSRKKKGAHSVSIYCCEERRAVDFGITDRKNHEIDCFMKSLSKIVFTKDEEEDEDFIFIADAINSRKNFVEFLNEREIDWILPIKRNNACKAMNKAAQDYFDKHSSSIEFIEKTTKKGHGRIEEKVYSMVDVNSLDTDVKFFENTAVIMRVQTKVTPVINNATEEIKPTYSEIYYISNLEYSEENFYQIKHSISVRWYYEQQHNTLDVVMLQDSQAVCDENHLAAIIGLNKCIYNVVTFARQIFTKNILEVKTKKAKAKSKRIPKVKPISYEKTFKELEDPLDAWRMLITYISTPKAENRASTNS